MELIEIELYDKREGLSFPEFVEQIGENEFRMYENAVLNCQLTKGTEFKTRLNKEGKHEVIEITKESEFITRRFLLSSGYSENEYKVVGDKIFEVGGYWQVDFSGIATINIPNDSSFDLDDLLKSKNLPLTEIVDDE